MAKRTTQPKSAVPVDMPFEEALEQLESIISALEHESLPLEELLSHYENGSKLINHCTALLNSAKDRVELISLNDSSTSSPSPTGPDAAADSNSDDIRLH